MGGKRLEAVMPGLELSPFTRGGFGLMLFAVLSMIGVLWLATGFAELLMGIFAPCEPILLHLFALFFFIRVSLAAAFTQLAVSWLRETKHAYSPRCASP